MRKPQRRARGLVARRGSYRRSTRQSRGQNAFTLVEVMVVMVLVGMLMLAGFGGLFSMDLCSRRMADYTAATAVVEGKIQDVMAATYNPPNTTNFDVNTTYKTNSDFISLDQAGTTFKVPGTLVTQLKPITTPSGVLIGHLVTVTGTFQEPRRTITVQLQTLVNKYSAGQQ